MAERRAKGEGTIFQRNGRWVARLVYEDPLTGLRKHTQVSGKTKAEASKKLREMRERVAGGSPARDDGMPFEKFAQHWLDTTLPASDRKQSTKTLYAGLTRTHIIGSDLGRLPMSRLRPSSVERFVMQLRQAGKSDSTVRQVYTIARAIGDAAVRDGHLARNPVAAVKRPSVRSTREAAYLTPTQVSALINAAEKSRYQPLFVLLVNTGMRRGEALALKWADVDLTNESLRVRGTLAREGGELIVTEAKTKRSHRTLPLSAVTLSVLRSLKARQASDRLRAGNKWIASGYVFTTELGEPCDPRNALRALKVAAKTAGLSSVGLHTLRHSAASTMLSSGVPLKVVSEILGHSGISITADVYGHVSPEVSRSAIDVLASALSANPGA